MGYIVSYTLKHKDTPDTFIDRWIPFTEENGQTLEMAKEHYNKIIETDGGEDGWWLYVITLSTILESTDYI